PPPGEPPKVRPRRSPWQVSRGGSYLRRFGARGVGTVSRGSGVDVRLLARAALGAGRSFNLVPGMGSHLPSNIRMGIPGESGTHDVAVPACGADRRVAGFRTSVHAERSTVPRELSRMVARRAGLALSVRVRRGRGGICAG